MLLFSMKKPIKSYTLNEKNFVKKLLLPKWYSKVNIGEYSYINDNAEVCSFRSPQTIVIGKYCSIGKCKFVVDGDHNISYASTFPFKEFGYSPDAKENKNIKPPPVIENDCWICDDSVIYGNVNIGNGAVVAGNAIVTKNVPAYAVVAGNPARIVKYRFDKRTIKRLLDSRWWELPHDFVVKELAPLMDDVELFLRRAEGYRR